MRSWRFQRRESTGATRFDWIRRVWRRPGARLAAPRETPPDWRDVLARRIFVVASVLAIWVVAIEVRLGYLQIIDHADLVARAGRQQMHTRAAPAKRGDIVDRHGRILATSVDTDTIYAVPTEIGNAEDTAAKLCQALGDCKEKERRSLVERLRQSRDFAYVRRQASPDVARRVADLNLEGVELPQGEPPLLSEPGARRPRGRLRGRRQHRARRHRSRLRLADPREARDGADPDRRAAPCVQPVREAADVGIDDRADDRPVPAARRGTRAARRGRREPRRGRQRHHHESAHGRDSRDGERADVQPERLSRVRGWRTPESSRSGSVRAGIDVQGRDRFGRDRRKGDAGRHADRHQPRRAPHRRTAEAGHRVRAPRLRRAVVHRRHRAIEQHRRDQDRIPRRHGAAEPLRVAVRIRPSGVAGLPGREPGHRVESGEVDRERAGVGVDGLSGRRDAAADGDGRQLGGQRRSSWSSRA